MQRNFPATPVLLAAFLFLLFFSLGCTKIDSTKLGADLIPAVDNVHTFADTLEITGTQGIFTDDSTRVAYTDYHPLGNIANDPVFGTTSTDLYVELKPGSFPFIYGSLGDTIANTIDPVLVDGSGFDSAVLCLSFKNFYGDTMLPQWLNVYQMDNNVTNFKDSSYRVNFRPDAEAGETLIGRASVDPKTLRNYTYFKGSTPDSANNQIRIKLDNSFLESLIGTNRDTSLATSMYKTDSLFKTKIKGFHIKADAGQGNGLFYVSLTDATTRLEVHYKTRKNNVIDTAYSAFYFSTGVYSTVSAQATHLDRDRTGEISTGAPGALYLQTAPGTYANLTIPGLSTFANSIIHRAELVVQQIPSAAAIDQIMQPPSYLYLDLINDTATSAVNQFKPVYYDLDPSNAYLPDNSTYFFPTNGINYNYFGGYLRVKDGGNGLPQYYYNFNISRYVQHIVTNDVKNYKLRLYTPFKIAYYGYNVTSQNLIADGRIKVGNGNNTDGYRMYLRIVYSKL